MATNNTRGPDPSERTIRILWGKAAGICEFEGCGEQLFYDENTTYEFNSAYVAHIIASSPSGPRGDSISSHRLSDKLDNIMLMCDKHHRLIDIERPEDYTVDILQKMKLKHEQSIEYSYSLLSRPRTQIVHFSSPIHNNQVFINKLETINAVVPQKIPQNQYPILVNVEDGNDESNIDHWKNLDVSLTRKFTELILPFCQGNPNTIISLFPLAPIPLIARLGNLFGDKIDIEVFQKHREPSSWDWFSTERTNNFNVKNSICETGTNVALLLSLSGSIPNEEISLRNCFKKIFRIDAENCNVNCIQSKIDLQEFWLCFQRTVEQIIEEFPNINEIHVFPAIPVSAAFEIGRRRMPGVYPPFKIYDKCNGNFIETIAIGV